MSISRKQGFTLVELVVSIAILSMVVLALVTAMRTMAKTQSTLDARSQGASQMMAVQRFLRGSLENASSMPVFQVGAPATHFFSGSADTLEWAAPTPLQSASGGLWSMKISLVEGELIVNMRSGQLWQPWTSDDYHYVLASAVEELKIGYRPTRFADWTSDWGPESEENKFGLPSHVSIRIKADGRYWPDLIVALPVGVQ